MSRFLSCALICILLCTFSIFAQETAPTVPPPSVGKPGKDFISAEGLENWQLQYDLSSFKPGKYNLLVKVVDSGGNISMGGPFNILVDPLSDLPVAQISNPMPFMRIGADLNIVGTCVDDDAVAAVEIKVDDGEWIKATGKDYWSYYLKTADIPDGLHALAARGIDRNGLAGNPATVQFHLDRTKPLHSISKPSFGTLVSGRISMAGTVYDANGLKNVSYSTDSGKTWKDLKFSVDKKKETGSFSLDLDTKKMEDGPAVVWFRTVDGVGSTGIAVFLYFIDNTSPELVFISPVENAGVNGEFVVSGRVYDKIGVQSLEWQYGKETGKIELVPGNPYFSRRFKVADPSGKMAVTFKVTDITGNITSVTATRLIDPVADLPVITLIRPAPDAKPDGRLFVSGGSRDDDGVAKILWRIDADAEKEVITDGAFAFDVLGLASGAHKFSVRAVDVNGLAGPIVERAFTWQAAAPRISFKSVTDSSGPRDFILGMSISTMDGKAVLTGSVVAGNPVQKLEYSINDGAAMPLAIGKSSGETSYVIPLPSSLPYGVLTLKVGAVDIMGKESFFRAPLYAINYSRPRVGPLLDFADAAGEVSITPKEPLLGAFIAPFAGEDIKSVSVEPPSSLVDVSFEGKLVSVAYKADGISLPSKVVVVTTRNHRFDAGPFVFRTDSVPPDAVINSPGFGSWHKADFALKATVSDRDKTAAVEYSVGEGGWQAMKASGSAYEAMVPIAGLAGPLLVSVRATDQSGNQSFARTAIMVDSQLPSPERIAPKPGAPAGGTTLFAFRPGETSWNVDSIEAVINGSAQALAFAPVISFGADAGAGPVIVRVRDKAGNVTELNMLEGLETAAKLVPVPALETVKTNNSSVDGSPMQAVLTGSDAVGKLGWSGPFAPEADEAAFPATPIRVSGAAAFTAIFSGVSPDPKKPEAYYGMSADAINLPLAIKASKTAGSWEASLKLPAVPDGAAALWIRIVDTSLGGPVFTKIAFEYDSTPAAIEVLAPGAGSPGTFLLVANATDAKGILSAEYEAGAEKGAFDLAPGSTVFARAFNFPAKGNQLAVVLRVLDGSGNKTTSTVTVTNDGAADAPQVRFLTPLDGSVRTFDEPIFVYAQDDDSVATVSLGIDGKTAGGTGPGPLYSLDAGTLPAGKRTASLVGVDANGLNSAKAAASFLRQEAIPEITILGSRQPKAAAETLNQGASLVVLDGTAIDVAVLAGNGFASMEYKLNDGAWLKLALPAKPLADGTFPVSLPLPVSLPFDRVLVSMKASDSAGLAALRQRSFYRVTPPSPSPVIDDEGIYLSDMRIDSGAKVLLAPGDEVSALFNGRPLVSATLEPPVPYMEVMFDGATVKLRAKADGLDAQAALVVKTVDGDEYRSQPLVFNVDSEMPELLITSPVSGQWNKASLVLDGTVSDVNGIASLEYSLDLGISWMPIKLPSASGPAGAAIPHAMTVNLEKLSDGPGEILVRVRDKGGREKSASVSFFKDTEAPRILVAAPRAADTVNGTVLLALDVEDSGDIKSVEYSADGVSWAPIAPESVSPRGSGPLSPTGKDAVLPPYAGYLAFQQMIDLAALPKGPVGMSFRVRDKSGNETVYAPLAGETPAFAVDIEADKPVAQIQIPSEMEVMRANFVVSGMAFDDDKVGEIFWRADGGDWTRLDGASSFSIPFKLLETADNEHVFETYAVDINGVRGDTVSRKYRVSREEPVGELLSPDVSITNRGVISLKGSASDANSVKEVWVSFDNGNTYNLATGTTAWNYQLDTRILADGVHSVYLKMVDGYDTPGFSAGLISVDNTAPVVDLDTPWDGAEFAGKFTIGGRTSDAIIVNKLVLEITPIAGKAATLSLELPTTSVFSRVVDLSALDPGWYNLKITASDRAQNESYVARNIVVLSSQKAETVEILFPVHGEKLFGKFSLEGRVLSASEPKKAVVYMNEQPLATVDINKEGYFSLPVSPDETPEGSHVFRVEVSSETGGKLISQNRTVLYQPQGPWLEITAVNTGDFIIGRPYVTGKVGWETPVVDKADKAAYAEYQKTVAGRKPTLVEFSRDNGLTFTEAKGTNPFKFRLETQEYPNGELRLLVRVTFANGEIAIRKRIVVIDTRPPLVTIIKPAENGRFNQSLSIEGTASDLNGLSEVSLIVRSGDKSSYEVPAFIQGSYFDLHMLGATRFETGIGLSFFEDKVKLQAEIGQGFEATPSWGNLLGLKTADTPREEISRFGGYILGAKLLASVAYIPFSYYFGPDWDFFSMSFALGATFTYFSQTTEIAQIFLPPGGKYMVLSTITGQWEFAKFTLDLPVFKSYGFYVEGGLVFIPSEASTKLNEMIRPNVGFGLRIGLF